MGNKPLRVSFTYLIAILALAMSLSGFTSISREMNYVCAGKSDNGMVTNREFPSLSFSGRQARIAGSDIFETYNYSICGENEALISFATRQELCGSTRAGTGSLTASYGSFDKVSGRLELFGAQGLHGEYQCKEAKKM
jgi:hypothetical protein